MRTVTDSAGVTVEYRPLHDLQPGDEIAGGWRPWAVVERVEHADGLARVHFASGPTEWFRPDLPYPVVVFDPKGENA